MSQRVLRWEVLLLLVALPGVMAHARAHHSEAWARDRYAAADRMREALNGRPPGERSRHDYQRVINAYRNVYYGAPTSTKADPSAVAVAETLVEMGRRFDDDKILNEAIAQYKFLRKEYPGSKYRCDALFTIGEIYKDDLNDPEQARVVFAEFVHRYPHNRLVEDAQQAVAELDRQSQSEKKADAGSKSGKNIIASSGKTSDRSKESLAAGTKAGSEKDAPAKTKSPDSGGADADSQADIAATDAGAQDSSVHSKRLPRVTGIRHWSTPDYTRVAIDLENEIKFGSQRIANPDRIFFDLRDTKLASTLVGKSFDVDDGFLKKIRVAQFQPGRTRVVLEVADLSDYEAFLLPNPYRLIIDIHGKNNGRSAHGKAPKDTAATTEDVEAPPKGGSSNAADDLDSASEAAATPTAAQTAAQKKEELRAEAGKAPVTRADVGDATQIVPKGSAAKRHPLELPRQVDATRETPAPTKVVVDNDDDDNSTPAPETHAPSHAPGKSSTRVTTSRKTNDLDVREARPTASGDRSLIRALGLKIGKIVIDPGHGGHDTGTIGPEGLQEKDLVLEVGRRLGKMLETRLGAEVVYTRKDDTFIPLETRTAIANQQRADLFISIHANSSHDAAARGVETYYLNFTSSPEALEVAARENAVSEKSIYELQDLVKKIALKEKIEESREFAGDVQESLHSGLAAKSPGIRNRGVKKAPFIVLIGANMPSILAEISFVSNPADEHRLETSEYRQRIAESLYHGIAKYVDGLSGVKMASKMDKAAGQ